VRLGGRVEVFSCGERWVIAKSSSMGREQAASRMSPFLAASKVNEWCENASTWPDMLELYEELAGTRALSPTSADIKEWIQPRLRRAFEDGELVVESPLLEQTTKPTEEGVHGQPTKIEPPSPPPARRPVSPPKTLCSFAIRFVDELGAAISGVDIAFTYGGTKEDVATDGNGVARVEDSPVRTASAKIVDIKALRSAVKPRWDQPRGERKPLDESQGVTVVLLKDKIPTFDLVADKVRVVSVQPSVERVRLIGGFFDKSKCLILPDGLQGIRGVVATYDAHTKSKLLVVGHTDTMGKPSYNDVLSLERADATKDYLTDNVDGWLKWYGNDVAADKRWGTAEDEHMIGALPDAGDRTPSEGSVRWFQRTRGLKVDGIAGPQTRRALIEEYMSLDGTSLPQGVGVMTHGCGENFPAEPTADETEDAANRRVEIYYFDSELGVQPPPPGQNSKAGSPEYPEWVRRAVTTDHVLTELDPVLIELVSSDDLPLPEVGYSITFADGSSQSGTLDKFGTAKIKGPPQGPFTVQYPDADDIRAKALAARIHQAITARDSDVIAGVLAQSPTTLSRIRDVYAQFYDDISGNGLVQDAQDASAGTPAEDVVGHLLAAGGLGAEDGPIVVAYAETNLGGASGTGTAVV
jgi:outer membrane protein OmpA-like peptidoglycan-associated protein